MRVPNPTNCITLRSPSCDWRVCRGAIKPPRLFEAFDMIRGLAVVSILGAVFS